MNQALYGNKLEVYLHDVIARITWSVCIICQDHLVSLNIVHNKNLKIFLVQVVCDTFCMQQLLSTRAKLIKLHCFLLVRSYISLIVFSVIFKVSLQQEFARKLFRLLHQLLCNFAGRNKESWAKETWRGWFKLKWEIQSWGWWSPWFLPW